jgi:hypothetical protein
MNINGNGLMADNGYSYPSDAQLRNIFASSCVEAAARRMLLSEQLNVSSERALDLFYTSKTCERLHDPSTLLYTFSDGYIVDDVLREIQK